DHLVRTTENGLPDTPGRVLDSCARYHPDVQYGGPGWTLLAARSDAGGPRRPGPGHDPRHALRVRPLPCADGNPGHGRRCCRPRTAGAERSVAPGREGPAVARHRERAALKERGLTHMWVMTKS